MKLRQIDFALRQLEEARQELREAQAALEHGGCSETMARKSDEADSAEQRLEQLLDSHVEDL